MASSCIETIALESLTVMQLRVLLRKAQRPTDGNKDELLYRLQMPSLISLHLSSKTAGRRLTIIRHARQAAVGKLDPPLAAGQTAPSYLAMASYQLVICSPYLRTRQTVELLDPQGTVPRLPPDPRLSEFLNGHRQGHYHPGTVACGGIPGPEESWRGLVARVEDFMSWARRLEPSVSVLVVTHGLVVKYLAHRLLPDRTVYLRGRDVPYMGGLEFELH